MSAIALVEVAAGCLGFTIALLVIAICVIS